ncbi:MAG: hypothetical protein GY880_21180, partial [Planctomycetaceae bacterium]|nr:hypothetical protein [Planctomycetaceae bacterium]
LALIVSSIRGLRGAFCANVNVGIPIVMPMIVVMTAYFDMLVFRLINFGMSV